MKKIASIIENITPYLLLCNLFLGFAHLRVDNYQGFVLSLLSSIGLSLPYFIKK